MPGPHDVVRLLERSGGAVQELLAAVPRLTRLLDEAEVLLRRAGGALDELERTRTAADDVVRRANGVVTAVEAVVSRVDVVVSEASTSVTRVDRVVTDAAGTVTRTGGVVDQAQTAIGSTEELLVRVLKLLDLTEPSLVRLQPTLERLAETTHPSEVDALVALVDTLPVLATRMQAEVIPIVKSLETVGPDIHDLLDLTAALNEMLGSVPGLGRVRKRIDDEQENDD